MSENISATYRITKDNAGTLIIRLDPNSPTYGCPHRSDVVFVNDHTERVAVSVYEPDRDERGNWTPAQVLDGGSTFFVSAKNQVTKSVIGGCGLFRLRISGETPLADGELYVATFVIYDEDGNGTFKFHCNVNPDEGGIQRGKGEEISFRCQDEVDIKTYTDTELTQRTTQVIDPDPLRIESRVRYGRAFIKEEATVNQFYYFGVKKAGANENADDAIFMAGTLKGCIKIKP